MTQGAQIASNNLEGWDGMEAEGGSGGKDDGRPICG